MTLRIVRNNPKRRAGTASRKPARSARKNPLKKGKSRKIPRRKYRIEAVDRNKSGIAYFDREFGWIKNKIAACTFDTRADATRLARLLIAGGDVPRAAHALRVVTT